MTWVAVAIGGSALLGSMAAGDAADAQAASAQAGMDSNERIAQRQIDNQNAMFDKQVALQQPFRDIGLNAQNHVVNMLNGRYSQDFGMQDFQQDPGYAFRMSQGLKALDKSAAARGGLISGNALKAAQNYGQEAASQEYRNAFNRYQVNRSNQLQPWQSLAGVGQSATTTLGGYAGQQGAGISSALVQLGAGNAQAYGDMGNARASGYVGGANALTGGLGNYLNYSQGNSMVNALRGGGTGYGAMTSGWGGGMLGQSAGIGDM